MTIQQQQTFDPDISLSFGSVRGVAVELVNGRQEPIGEWYLYNNYCMARDGWMETLETLRAAHDVIEQLQEQVEALRDELARLRELDDMEATQFDASIYGQ